MAVKDDVTEGLPGVPKKRGRPPSGNAMTPSERQAKYLARLAAENKKALTVVVSQEVQDALSRYVEFKDMTLGEAVDRILRDRLLRKR